MSARSLNLLAGLAGLLVAAPLPGQQPPPPLGVAGGRALAPSRAPAPNQEMANTIAEQLRQSGQLRSYTIDISFQDGTAELSGTVADQPQREEALRIVQGVPGVERVRDRLALASASGVTQVKAPQPTTEEPPLLPPASPPREPGPAIQVPSSPPPSTPGGEPAPLEAPPGQRRSTDAPAPNEPLPIYQAPRPMAYDLNPPKMPPYAWPTYAPYNNYSRVAYPMLYPYQSWPYIGPAYPFPKVPLGWRKVTLEWQDGHWWYGKNACGHDWWRLRYW